MEKVKKVLLWVAIVLFDTIMHSNITTRSSRGQGHLVTLAKDHMSIVCQHFQRAFPLGLLGLFHLNFKCSLQAKGERKFIYLVQVT